MEKEYINKQVSFSDNGTCKCPVQERESCYNCCLSALDMIIIIFPDFRSINALPIKGEINLFLRNSECFAINNILFIIKNPRFGKSKTCKFPEDVLVKLADDEFQHLFKYGNIISREIDFFVQKSTICFPSIGNYIYQLNKNQNKRDKNWWRYLCKRIKIYHVEINQKYIKHRRNGKAFKNILSRDLNFQKKYFERLKEKSSEILNMVSGIETLSEPEF